MFAIIGISIFRNRFGYCDSMDNFGVGIQDVLFLAILIFLISVKELGYDIHLILITLHRQYLHYWQLAQKMDGRLYNMLLLIRILKIKLIYLFNLNW